MSQNTALCHIVREPAKPLNTGCSLETLPPGCTLSEVPYNSLSVGLNEISTVTDHLMETGYDLGNSLYTPPLISE